MTRPRTGVSPETMAELKRAAAELNEARAYVRARPHLLELLPDETALDVIESWPDEAKGVA